MRNVRHREKDIFQCRTQQERKYQGGRKMDIGGLLSSPIGIAIAVIAGLILVFAAWKINKLAIKLLFILIVAAIAAAVLFFRKGGF
jgi:hypothetical protein